MLRAHVQQDADHKLLFLPSLFQEAMDIIFESYEYFEVQENIGTEAMPEVMRIVYAQEMSRITVRMTSVMAWLMARRAVLAGQLEDHEAAEHYRLDAVDECLAKGLVYADFIPEYMNQLLSRSLELYSRVLRLDYQLYDEGLGSDLPQTQGRLI